MDSAINSSLINESQHKFFNECSPIFIEYKLMREFLLFQQQNISSVYICPSASSALKWFGVMFINYGIYQSAVLKFTLLIPQSYPDCRCPKIIFDPIPFHPFVNSSNGEFNVEKAFPNWKSTSNHLWEIILYAKRVFHNLELEFDENKSHLMSNIEAANLFKSNIHEFKSKVAQNIEDCRKRLNITKDSDLNEIVFGDWNNYYENLRKELLSGSKLLDETTSDSPLHPSSTGLSWVQKGSLKTFSKSGA